MFPTCSSIRRLSITSQYDILKMNEPISLQFGTWSMSMGQEDLKMKRSTLGVMRSKINVTRHLY